MIAGVAKKAGIKTPKNPDDDFDRNAYPHFFVFCEITLGRAISAGTWHSWAEYNAKIIASLSEERIKTMTLGNLVDVGVELSCF